jgi:hypothetical protein
VTAQGIEQAEAALARLEPVLRAAEAEVRRIMRRLPLDADGERLDSAGSRNAQEVARQLRAAVADLRREVEGLAPRIAREAAQAESDRLGMTLEPRLQQQVDAIVRDRLAELTDSYGEIADDMGRAVRIATTTGARLSTLESEIAGKLALSQAQARTLIDTTAMGSARLVFVQDVEDASERAGTPMVFVFLGPLDSITRPFCRDIHTKATGQAYSSAALAAMDNGQIGPVSAYAGGYNCRHRWVAITRAEAVRRGLVVVE